MSTTVTGGRRGQRGGCGHLSADALRAAADYLSTLGLIEVFEVTGNGGRPSILYRAK